MYELHVLEEAEKNLGKLDAKVAKEVTMIADKTKKVSMMVDTGAPYSLISKELAKELGVKPLRRKVRVELADGNIITQQIGSVIVRINGRETPATVLIAPGVEPLLGVETLEGLGLAVDPSSGELKPTRSFTVRLGGYHRPPR